MKLPTTLLPIVSKEIFDGLAASEYDPQVIIDELKISNPEVWSFIHHLIHMGETRCARTCLLLYKILETQAECDELRA